MDDTTRLLRRLWDNTTIDPVTGCWTWTGSLDRNGYGKIRFRGQTRAVHRIAMLHIGREFDTVLTLDHLCRNRACWNPAHLDAVTNRENILRGVAPTAVNAARTECTNGHPFDEANTRWRHRPGRNAERQCRECDRQHERRRRRTRAA